MSTEQEPGEEEDRKHSKNSNRLLHNTKRRRVRLVPINEQCSGLMYHIGSDLVIQKMKADCSEVAQGEGAKLTLPQGVKEDNLQSVC